MALGSSGLNIVFFQFGDYGAAYRNLKAGGSESFRDQKYSVDFVASFTGDHRMSTVAICDRPHDEDLAPNLHSVGLTLSEARQTATVRRILTELAPGLIVLRTPHITVLEWARKRRVPTLPIFADFMAPPRGPRSWLQAFRMRRVLDDGIFPAVSNHSLNASLSLVENLHLPAHRVVPWDSALLTVDATLKSGPVALAQINAFYAGTLSEDKGVGDCLEAVQLLKARNIRLVFRLAGAGDTAAWQARAQTLGIGDQVTFLGIIANAAVRDEMRRSDMVIIPSRHSYAEGLPNTLVEGLASRTPVICSDHPAFADRLRHGVDVLMFQGASAPALADAVQRLASDAGLYATLSANAAAAYKGLFFGTDWGDLIRLFLNDPQNRTGWVKDRSLEALLQARAANNHGP
jgi:glycosyltransferase involved in cell wall biosynthesis